MNIFEISEFNGNVEKVSGTGSIDFRLWSVEGEIYVQIVSNNANSRSSGTVNNNLIYSLGSYVRNKEVKAISIRNKKYVTDRNTNTKGFLRAIVEALLGCH
ncbi:hypothetical protein K6U49_08510 [Vibrio alginolyticus]|uniref:hypothetical protein n=1 Tax=Vibrio alginolyticus TaxID=663 RepID=UPI001EEA6CD6|nr:hypothetical protein [Vibrio alginolyticus]MCG6308636.1 hypothetical protein [Vibrio alginolyticus]